MTINNLKQFLSKPVPNIGLELFRISYNSVLFFEILHFFKFRHLIFDEVPYVFYEIDFGPAIMIWATSVACIVIGFQTKLVTIVNYIFTVTFFSTMADFEYHMQYAYLGLNFIQMLTPLGKRLSIDQLQNKKTPDSVARIYYLAPIFFGLAVVYIDSIIFKLTSPMWTSGLGMWLPASLPVCVNIDLSFLLNNEILIKALGYTTIVFETIFILTFWIKKMRIPLLIVGSGLHFGIFVAFPIPLFALGAISLYVLMVPEKFWKQPAFLKPIKISRQWYEPYGFNVKTRTLYAIFIVLIGLQTFSSANAMIRRDIFQNRYIEIASNLVKFPSKSFFGITHHPVFMDNHFDGYNHVIGIQESSSKTWIPVTDESGKPGDYLNGDLWVNWTFRVNAPHIDQEKSVRRMKKYIMYWIYTNDHQGNRLVFDLMVKKIDTPNGWEHGFLERQLSQPWVKAGKIIYQDNTITTFEVKEIESI